MSAPMDVLTRMCSHTPAHVYLCMRAHIAVSRINYNIYNTFIAYADDNMNGACRDLTTHG